MDDAGQYTGQEKSRWLLQSTNTRFSSLAAKYAALCDWALTWVPDIILIWENDVYTREHLYRHAIALENGNWSIPQRKWVDHWRRADIEPEELLIDDLRIETHQKPVCHGSWAYRADMLRELQPYHSAGDHPGFDVFVVARTLNSKFGPATDSLLEKHNPTFCYRVGWPGTINGSSYGRNWWEKTKGMGNTEAMNTFPSIQFDRSTTKLLELIEKSLDTELIDSPI